jgi:hypothetical protein
MSTRVVVAEDNVKHINTIFARLHLTEETDTQRRVRAVRLWLADQRSTLRP